MIKNGVAASASGRREARKSVDGNFMLDISVGEDGCYDGCRDGSDVVVDGGDSRETTGDMNKESKAFSVDCGEGRIVPFSAISYVGNPHSLFTSMSLAWVVLQTPLELQ